MAQVYPAGISVIIPCYQSAGTVGETLVSLANQTLDPENFEVIIVLNGPDDGSHLIVAEVREKFPNLNVRAVTNHKLGAGSARNLGICMARHMYITFVDSDDYVEQRFLETLLFSADLSHIVASPIHNLLPDGEIDKLNSLNFRIRESEGERRAVADVSWMLGFNACKLVPTQMVRDLRYREDLVSGEDLVFFAELLRIPDLEVVFPPSTNEDAYVRRLREDSVSRQKESYDFNVRQRLLCMQALDEVFAEGKSVAALNNLKRAQFSFVRNYFSKYPHEAEKLESTINEIGYREFPWNWLNDGKAQDLVISYCFPPFSDTSAVVAAKAVNERRRLVDVISQDMGPLRNRDNSLFSLAGKWIDRTDFLGDAPSFSDWQTLQRFGESALSVAEKNQQKKGILYRTLYTRALWAGSHVAGLMFKIKHPDVFWTAEFSDPIRFGVDGLPRPASAPEGAFADELQALISTRAELPFQMLTAFDLLEATTMLLADELVFTNKNQQEYMLESYPPEWREEIEAKSTIRPHPTPPPEAYESSPVDLALDTSKMNLAYFGAFYKNRGLGDVLAALMNLPSKARKRISLHVFTSNSDDLQREVERFGVGGLVELHDSLPYMEFLNATKKFDVLIVNDIVRDERFSICPFLPSKYSDYRGAGTPIWALIDSGSPLSQMPLSFRSEVGNVPQAIGILSQIAE